MLIFSDFGKCKDGDPALPEAQALVKRLQAYISENYYQCTPEILQTLGAMYGAGGEFTENIDKAGGEGTAKFVERAISIHWNISDASLGTEELGHLEMVGTIVHQLTRNLTEEQQQESSFAPYFVDHTAGVYPQAASGTPWSAATMQVMGDPISDLCENLAAEQKARSTYDNILRLSDDPDVNDVIRFLRAREVVHFQRFGEAIEKLREHLDRRNVYLYNPAIEA